MLRWLLSLCLALLLIALITSPTEKEFGNYVYGRVDTSFCKPILKYNRGTYFNFFSLNDAWEFKQTNPAHDPVEGPNDMAIVFCKEHRYLGLFGTFWEL